MAPLLTRFENADAAFDAKTASFRRSVPVRLIRRVVDAFQGRGPGNLRRAVAARMVMVWHPAAAPVAAVAVRALPRVPVRLVRRHLQNPPLQAATAIAEPLGRRAFPVRLSGSGTAPRRPPPTAWDPAR